MRTSKASHLRLGLALLCALLVPACSSPGRALWQDAAAEVPAAETAEGDAPDAGDAGPGPNYDHLPLGWDDAGLSFGNSRRWSGLRINFRDHGVEDVKGVNVTLWPARRPSLQHFEGLALGLSTRAVRSSGASLGLLAAIGEESLVGVQAGGLATVCEGRISGLSVGGLAVVAKGGLRGVSAGGLAVVSEGHMRGVNVGGLAVVSGSGQRGVNLAGLAVVSEGSQRGINLAGLACVSGSDLRGVSLAGLAAVADHEIRGVAAALLATQTQRMTGLAVSGYNRVDGQQTGLSVGLYNHAQRLDGIQIGLLNHVAENPRWARWLPIVNAHF